METPPRVNVDIGSESASAETPWETHFLLVCQHVTSGRKRFRSFNSGEDLLPHAHKGAAQTAVFVLEFFCDLVVATWARFVVWSCSGNHNGYVHLQGVAFASFHSVTIIIKIRAKIWFWILYWNSHLPSKLTYTVAYLWNRGSVGETYSCNRQIPCASN